MDNDKPYSGFSLPRLTELINIANDANLQEGVDFTFGPPSPYSDSKGRNTKVQITPTNRRRRKQEIHYKRLPLDVLNQLPDGSTSEVEITALPFNTRQILPKINEALGINLTENEIEDEVFSSKLVAYPLKINSAVSLAWIDSDFKFKAKHTDGLPSLSDMTPFNVLDGFQFVRQ